MVVFLVLSLAICFGSMWYSKPMALKANQAHIITRSEEPRLYATVEKVAAKAGLPMPEVGISECPMPNAFATGRNPKNAAVVATRGLLALLNDDELEGVIGHEMSHVKNRDIMVMSSVSAVVMVLTFASRVLILSSMGSRDKNNGIILIVGLLLYIFVPIGGMLLQMAVSRNREYLADETGARITRKPLALASALRKLAGGCANPRNDYSDNAHANMWISDPIRKKKVFGNLFSTHPSTENRIARLEKLAQMMDAGSIPEYAPEEKYGNVSGLSFDR